MQTDMRDFKRALLIYLGLGLLLGGVWDILWWQEINKTAQESFIFNMPLYLGLCIFCLTYALSYNEKHNLRLLVSSFFVAFLLSLPFYITKNIDMASNGGGNLLGNEWHFVSFLMVSPLFIYVGHSFHYAYHQDNTWKVSYSSLFAAVWDSFVIFFIGSIFAQISSLLIFLAVVLFSSLGFNELKIIYSNGYFSVVLHSILLFIGLCIAQQNHKMMHNLRFLLLRMVQFLFPLLAVIIIIYFILYLIALAHQTGGENLTPIVLLGVMILLGIVFFNACFQTGNDSIKFPRWLTFLFKVYHVVLFCLTLQFIRLCFKSFQFPLNVSLLLLITFLYTLSYAIAAFFQNRHKMRGIRAANISIALFFLVSVFIINNPFYPVMGNLGTFAPLASVLQPINFPLVAPDFKKTPL